MTRQKYYFQFLTNTEKKVLDLKISTLEYRSWTTDLYNDFCNAIFYSKFVECDKDFYMSIAGTFSTLIKHINEFPWDVVSGAKTKEGKSKFKGNTILIEDSKDRKPIESIKSEG